MLFIDSKNELEKKLKKTKNELGFKNKKNNNK
jgi:hypothetical protein